MTKEETFKLLTGLILDLKDKNKFIQNPQLVDEWKARHSKLNPAIANLSDQDKKWLSEKYDIWFRLEIGNPQKIKEYMTELFVSDIPKR